MLSYVSHWKVKVGGATCKRSYEDWGMVEKVTARIQEEGGSSFSNFLSLPSIFACKVESFRSAHDIKIAPFGNADIGQSRFDAYAL